MGVDGAPANAVIVAAKRLLSVGQRAEAQELLLDEGYVKRLEPAIQRGYLRLVPIGATLKEMLAEAYEGLEAPYPEVRFKAITMIARELNKSLVRGRRGKNGDKVVWVRDPRASAPLITASADPDAKVAERALGTLARLVCQHFPDQRATAAFRAKLPDPKETIRKEAISGIANLRQEKLLALLVGLFDRGSDGDRFEVARQLAGWSSIYGHPKLGSLLPIEWSPRGRRFWSARMIAALRDPAALVRRQAAIALSGALGDRTVVPALESARVVESDADVAYWMGAAITALENRPA